MKLGLESLRQWHQPLHSSICIMMSSATFWALFIRISALLIEVICLLKCEMKVLLLHTHFLLCTRNMTIRLTALSTMFSVSFSTTTGNWTPNFSAESPLGSSSPKSTNRTVQCNQPLYSVIRAQPYMAYPRGSCSSNF